MKDIIETKNIVQDDDAIMSVFSGAFELS